MVLVSSPPSNQAFKGISSLLLSSFDSTHASLGTRRPLKNPTDPGLLRGDFPVRGC
jgi:hypothetical protein